MILKSAASVVAPSSLAQQPRKNECAKSVTDLAPIPQGASKECRMPRRVPIVELNEHLTCSLCKGYFIDATTIIECLHSFCRSCIVKYLESNKYCPVCDVQVHKTKPLLNIRPDKTLQDIVYKLVPRLFQDEMRRCREFYAERPESKPSSQEQRGEASYQHLLTPDEMLCISLMYDGATEPSTPRYLRCPAAVSMSHLQKLIRAKYDLCAYHRVDILHNKDCLNSYLTLMDVAYIYLWRRKGPLALTYRIYENIRKMTSNHSKHANSNENNNNNDTSEEGWKEVQLRISENGEMSVTGIQDCLSLLEENILQDDKTEAEAEEAADREKEKQKETSTKCEPAAKKIKLEAKEKPQSKGATTKEKPMEGKRETRAALQLKNAATNEPTCETAAKETAAAAKTKTQDKDKGKDNKDKAQAVKVVKDCRKRKSVDEKSIEGVKKAKLTELQSTLPSSVSLTEKSKSPPVVLNHALGLQNLSNNHPLKKHSLLISSNISSGPLKSSVTEVANKLVSLATSTTTTSSAYKSKEYQSAIASPAVKPAKSQSAATSAVILSQMSKAVSASTLKVSTGSCSSSVKSTASFGTSTTTSTYTSPSLAKSVPTSQQNYAQFTNRVYTPPSPNYVPINVPSVPKLQPGMSPRSSSTCPPIPPIIPLQQAGKSKHLQNYKTLRDPPKTWNPQLPRPEPKNVPNDLRNIRPAKFFKMRNNMPRYLGNPASGVKPMYTVQGSPEKDKAKEKEDSNTKSKKEATDLNKKVPASTETPSKTSKEVPDLIPSKKLTPEAVKSSALSSSLSEHNKKPTPEPTTSQTKRNCSSTEIKKHSIVKIDPKTLKPISERAPEISSLSVTSPTSSSMGKYTPDLKINISSVSIFNPIKLQQQSERKSPQSPINKKSSSSPSPTSHLSPVNVSPSTSSSPLALPPNLSHMPGLKQHHQHQPNQHQKPLSFTPTNPFVPNLQAPTMSPNQYMYAQPGLTWPYDPMMAAFIAYHRAPFTSEFHKQMQQMQYPMGGLMMNQPQVEKKSPQHQLYPHAQEGSPSRKKPNETAPHKKIKKEEVRDKVNLNIPAINEPHVDKSNGNLTKTSTSATNLSNKSSPIQSSLPSPSRMSSSSVHLQIKSKKPEEKGEKMGTDETKDVNKQINNMHKSSSTKQDWQGSRSPGNARTTNDNDKSNDVVAVLDNKLIVESRLESNQMKSVKEVASLVSKSNTVTMNTPTTVSSSKPPKSLQNALDKLTKAKKSDYKEDVSGKSLIKEKDNGKRGEKDSSAVSSQVSEVSKISPDSSQVTAVPTQGSTISAVTAALTETLSRVPASSNLVVTSVQSVSSAIITSTVTSVVSPTTTILTTTSQKPSQESKETQQVLSTPQVTPKTVVTTEEVETTPNKELHATETQNKETHVETEHNETKVIESQNHSVVNQEVKSCPTESDTSKELHEKSNVTKDISDVSESSSSKETPRTNVTETSNDKTDNSNSDNEKSKMLINTTD